tara:strand:+ start:1320 stop:3872 length:2553 start_codon:yes stop_codon:yes gene_type:complete
MGLDSIIVRQLASITKNSGKLDETVDQIKSKVLDKGLELLEETGINPSIIPVDIPSFLRGEIKNFNPQNLINPEVICAQPLVTVQKRESSIRLINASTKNVEGIYATTNNIKTQLQALQIPVNKLNNTVDGISSTVSTVSAVIKTIKLLPFPVAVLGVGIPANILTIYSSVLDSMDKLLSMAKTNLISIPKAIAIMAKTLNTTIEKVNSLNLVIDPLLQFLQLSKSIIELQDSCVNQGGNGISPAQIEGVKNSILSSIEGSLVESETITVNGDNLAQLLQPNADPGYFYKNFRFTLENDPDNTFFLPSRRIKCFRRNSTGFNDGVGGGGSITFYNINNQTNQGSQFQTGSYSYSSDLQVLINEGKFAVDVYTDGITLWEAPQVTKNTISSSFSIGNLPTYIRTGGSNVNLNNSPTDIEFGANALNINNWYQDTFNIGGTTEISSYIQSGVIQVNAPINIRMQTLGGSGNNINNKPRFTEALFTLKRSTSIQDNIDPLTGKLKTTFGYGEGGTIYSPEDFNNQYKNVKGQTPLEILNMVYQTFNEGTTSNNNNSLALANLDISVFGVNNPYQKIENGEVVTINDLFNFSYTQQLEFINYILNNSINLNKNQEQGIIDIVNTLYNKSYYILYNEKVLGLSEQIWGNTILTQTDIKLSRNPDNIIGGVNYINLFNNLTGIASLNSSNINYNWWLSARRFSSKSTNNYEVQVYTLIMLYQSTKQYRAQYEKIFGGDRSNYNNGSWALGTSDLPIIPTQVGGENSDVTVVLQVTQLAGVNEVINEIIGGVSMLGTYTYDLEIIDSRPFKGGESFNYPTNYTSFTIEDMTTNSASPTTPPQSPLQPSLSSDISMGS